MASVDPRTLKALAHYDEAEAECKALRYDGQLQRELTNLGVSQREFDDRLGQRKCVACGSDTHMLRSCPQYTSVREQRIMNRGMRRGQQAGFANGQQAEADARDRRRSKEERLREEYHQRTRKGQQLHTGWQISILSKLRYR